MISSKRAIDDCTEPRSGQFDDGARLLHAIFFSFSAAVIVATRLYWLYEHPLPISSDGFFYLQELRQRIERGGPYYQQFSSYFTLAEFFIYLTGLPVHTAYNLLVLVGLVTSSLAFGLALQRRQCSFLIPLLIVLYWGSDLLFYRHYAFPKQAAGVATVLLGFSFIDRGGFGGSHLRKTNIGVGVALLLLGASFHTFAAFLSGSFLGVGLLLSQFGSLRLRFIAALAIALTGGIYLTLTPKELFDLQGLRFSPGWIQACEFAECSNFEWFEFVFSLVVILFSASMLAAFRSWRLAMMVVVPYLLLNAPVWERDGHMLYRLAFASQWILFIALVLTLLQFSSAVRSWKGAAFCAFVGCGFLFSLYVLPHKSYKGPSPSIDTLFDSAPYVSRWLPHNAVVRAPHGIQFRVTYFWERRSISAISKNAVSQNLFDLRQSGKRRKSCVPAAELPGKEFLAKCVLIEEGWVIKSTRRDI